MSVRVAEHVEHHHAVGHCREDRAQSVLPVEALAHPRHSAIDRALPQPCRKQRFGGAQHDVDAAEEPEPKRLLLRRLRRRPDRRRRLAKQLVDRDALGIARLRLLRLQHQERHDHGAAPIRDLVEVEREPARQQHDLDRHHRHRAPGNEPEQGQHHPREHIGVRGAAARQDRLPRPHHVRSVDRIPDHLEREIGLHAGAHVEGAVVEQRPTAVLALDATQIDRDLGFELARHRLGEIVAQQDIFGRNGGVGFELEHPMPVRLLQGEQRAGGRLDAPLRSGARRGGYLGGGERALHVHTVTRGRRDRPPDCRSG